MLSQPDFSGNKDFGTKWSAIRLERLRDYNKYLGFVRCNNCKNTFPQLFDIFIDENVYRSCKKSNETEINQRRLVNKCEICHAVGSTLLTSNDVFQGLEIGLLTPDNSENNT